jgi:hypothetical protein
LLFVRLYDILRLRRREVSRPTNFNFNPCFPVTLLVRPQAEKSYDATHALKHRGNSGNQHRPFTGEY